MASRGAFDIVQPDVTKVGGISEQRRIAWMADDFGIRYVGHGWNTALGVAADLQLAAAFPATDLVEFIGGSPYVDGILADPFELDADGFLAIPEQSRAGHRSRPRETRALHARSRSPVSIVHDLEWAADRRVRGNRKAGPVVCTVPTPFWKPTRSAATEGTTDLAEAQAEGGEVASAGQSSACRSPISIEICAEHREDQVQLSSEMDKPLGAALAGIAPGSVFRCRSHGHGPADRQRALAGNCLGRPCSDTTPTTRCPPA